MNENVDIKVADLYIRIPMWEDSEAQRSYHEQLDQLKKHCLESGLKAERVIVDRGSGRTFDRTKWKEYQSLIESTRSTESAPKFVLFTYWHKFSRNSVELVEMIKHLENFAIYPKQMNKEPDYQYLSADDYDYRGKRRSAKSN